MLIKIFNLKKKYYTTLIFLFFSVYIYYYTALFTLRCQNANNLTFSAPGKSISAYLRMDHIYIGQYTRRTCKCFYSN